MLGTWLLSSAWLTKAMRGNAGERKLRIPRLSCPREGWELHLEKKKATQQGDWETGRLGDGPKGAKKQ